MTETANVQLNNLIPLPFAYPYIKIPTGINHLPSGAQLIGGLFYSFSGEKDQDGVYSTICRTRKAMKESLFLSFTTLTRDIALLIDNGFVSRLSRDEYIFNRDKLKSPDEFTRIEFNEIAQIMDGFDRVQGVRLRIFAWFNARCNNDKKCGDPGTEKLRKYHKISASYSDIAEDVGCSERQAIRAVKWLLKHNYIHRPDEDKGKSITDKSVYSLDRSYWRRKKCKDPKPADISAKSNSTTNQQATVAPDQAARAARQLWLERVKEMAITEAEHNTQRAQRNKRYMAAHKRVVDLNIEIAFKELYDDVAAAKLEVERAHWLAEETAALKKLGLTADLLDEEYLFKLYSAGGAPPGDKKFVGAGEQNKK